MTNDQLSVLRSKICGGLRQIEQSTSQLREDLVAVTEQRPSIIQDELDYALDEGDMNTRLEINELNMALRSQLQKALRKIEDGTFGICATCKEAIDLRRLEALPSAELCMKCQKTDEAKPKIHREAVAWVSSQNFWGKRGGVA